MKYQFYLRHQPLKLIYLAWVAWTLVFIRLPLWTLLYFIPPLRPRSSWTLRRSLIVKVLQVVVPAVFNTQAFDATRLDPHVFEKREFEVGLVWIDPAPELVVGEIKEYARINEVEAAPVPAFWIGERGGSGSVGQQAKKGEKVILNFHSGGFVMMHAGPSSGSYAICKDMLAHFPQFRRALNVEYRLSRGPPQAYENPFPAALIDAITAYNYLLSTLHFLPENILVMGDSAGGSIALQIARFIAHTQTLPTAPPLLPMPMPRGMFLLSPTTDWGGSHTLPGSSMMRFQSTDWIDGFTSGYSARALLGRLPRTHAFEDAWISPASRDLPNPTSVFAGFPPTFMLAGGAETSLDQILTTYERMKADGVEAEMVVYPDATHVLLGMPWHEEEKEGGYKAMRPWVERCFPLQTTKLHKPGAVYKMGEANI